MGVRNLNRFLREKCKSEIKQISLKELQGKKIVIDTSIYMYKFKGDEGLIDGIYQLISLFRYYNITPVFVFDGEAPQEKKKLLNLRKVNKDEAEIKYNMVKERLSCCSKEEEVEIQAEMVSLKKKFIRLKNKDISEVKQLIKLCGITYYDADGEADQLCAKLVIKNKAYACLSEDMDMFVYKCPRVLRYLSLLNSTVVMYDFNEILNNLHWTSDEFQQICVLSGSDYNIDSTKNTNLFETVKWFEKYMDFNKNSKTDKLNFYDWLDKNTNYIKDYCNLMATLVMFDLSGMNVKKFDKQKIINGPINDIELHIFLYDYGFLFV